MSGQLPLLRTAIGAVLPQDPQQRLARPARRRQTSHSGVPASVRAATGLTLPQPLQGSAICQARHLWQAPPPSLRNSGRPVRPQATHAATARAAEPRLISSAASLPATGGAPQASAAGSAARALASWSSACPPGATTRTAASITGRGSEPSATAASSTT
jgi:hypothetical protein